MNQIDGICQTIEKTINQAVQKTLDQLEKDSDLICSTISSRLEKDRLACATLFNFFAKANLPVSKITGGNNVKEIKGPDITCERKYDIKSRFHLFACRAEVAYNKSVRLHSFLCGALGIVLPTLFILSFIVNTFSKEQLGELFGEGAARFISILTVSPESRAGFIICTYYIGTLPYYFISFIFCIRGSLSVCFVCSNFPTGNSDVFMGLDTRRRTGCVCDHVWKLLLPFAFPSKTFCRVSVKYNMNICTHRDQK